MKILFFVWASHSIRARSISKHLGASLFLLSTSRVKHPVLFIKTLRILLKERPDIVFCQSPPISCAFVVTLYCYFCSQKSRPKVLIDLHSGAIERPWSKSISKFVMQKANANIVTNIELQKLLITNYNIKPIILEDPVPDLAAELSRNRGYQVSSDGDEVFKIAVISSFADDEPLEAVLKAAAELPDIKFFITGNTAKIYHGEICKKSPNIIFTGFVHYDDYVHLIQQVDAIMDLTTSDRTMVAGAYEAVALGQPLITSNWNPLRRYFNKGTIHVDNTQNDIKRAIRIAQKRKEELKKEMRELRSERIKEYEKKICNLKNFLDVR